MSLPVCTLSPICNSDIVTDLPFWRQRLAVEGRQGIFIFILGHLKCLKLSLGKGGKDILAIVVVVVVVVVVDVVVVVVVIVVGGGDVVVLYNVMLGEPSQQ